MEPVIVQEPDPAATGVGEAVGARLGLIAGDELGALSLCDGDDTSSDAEGDGAATWARDELSSTTPTAVTAMTASAAATKRVFPIMANLLGRRSAPRDWGVRSMVRRASSTT